MHPLTLEFISCLQKLGENELNVQHLFNTHGYPLLKNWDKLIETYNALSDIESKNIYKKVIVFRLLEAITIPDMVYSFYPLISKSAWSDLELAAQKICGVEGDTLFDRIETWILKGYDHPQCHVCLGDIVLDIGAFTGNTTCYFSQQAGETGKVYSFEPHPIAFSQLKKNTFSIDNIACLNIGCSDNDGKSFITDSGTGSRLSTTSGIPIIVRTIDNLVDELHLEKVDFIKMDIEGLEPEALSGAKKTIKMFHPKLAISIYHSPEHYFSIYNKINSLDIPYNFYIKHSSYNRYETILFAAPIEYKYIQNNNIYQSVQYESFLLSTFSDIIFKKNIPLPIRFRELSTWECFVQLTKNFHIYNIARKIYSFFKRG